MKKKYPILILLIFMQIIAFSQTETYPQIHGTFGGSSELANDYDIMFSAGLTFYHTYENENFSVSEGFNQIIYTTTDISETEFSDFEITTFPNPSSGIFYVRFSTEEQIDYQYSVFDVSGKLITSKTITKNLTEIDLTELSGSLFFLNITDNQNSIKNFKIIKSQ